MIIIEKTLKLPNLVLYLVSLRIVREFYILIILEILTILLLFKY